MTDKDALLREALPCVQYSVNKWAERACAIAQKSFWLPSGAVPTKQQVDETFDKWKQMERLAARITAALAEKDDVWIKCSERLPDNGVECELLLVDGSRQIGFARKGWAWGFCTQKSGGGEAIGPVTHWRPLPPLPKGDE